MGLNWAFLIYGGVKQKPPFEFVSRAVYTWCMYYIITAHIAERSFTGSKVSSRNSFRGRWLTPPWAFPPWPLTVCGLQRKEQVWSLFLCTVSDQAPEFWVFVRQKLFMLSKGKKHWDPARIWTLVFLILVRCWATGALVFFHRFRLDLCRHLLCIISAESAVFFNQQTRR